MKKTAPVIAALFCSFVAFAQGPTKKEALHSFVLEHKTVHARQQERVAAAVMAGTPRTIALAADKIAVLVDYVDGRPYYISTHNLQARRTTGVEAVQASFPQIQLSGEGLVVGVWDAGLILATHVEFAENRVSNRYGSETNNHATHVAGTIGAAGVNPQAKGMLPKVKILGYYGFDDDLGQMAAEAASGLVLSNHSYGLLLGWEFDNGSWQWFGGGNSVDSRFGYYSSESRSLDRIAQNAPYYTMVWSAGNHRSDTGNGDRPPDGPYDCLGPSAVAKNVMTVGAITGFINYSGPASAVMSSFSSWGPTNDGRIKPDVVGDGVGVLSTSSSGNEAYTTLQGTSMSAPNVTGSLGLLQQYFRQSADTFLTSAALKALAIHTAREAGSSPGPDYRFGWGVLNVESAFYVLRDRNGSDTLLVEDALSNGMTRDYFLLSDGRRPITATIAWTDPPGTPPGDQNSTQPMLVNDLDILLISATGQTVRPWILDGASPGTAAKRGDNTLDNVEKIEILAPEPGLYTLRVSHKGTLVDGVQAYGLVMTGSSVKTKADPIYWVDGPGAVSEDHWSELPGGAPDAAIQPSGRTWVFDDSGTLSDDDVIILDQNMTVENFVWASTKKAAIELNGDTLFVEREFIVTNNLKIKNGVVVLKSVGSPTLKLPFDGKDGCTLILENTASVEVMGNVNLQSLVARGPIVIDSQSLELGELIFDSGSDVMITGSSISIAQALTNRTEALNLRGNGWTIVGATLDALAPFESSDTADFLDEIDAEGQWNFASLRLGGELQWNGTLEVGHLFVGAGSSTVGHENSRIVVTESVQIATGADVETRMAGLSAVDRAVMEIVPREILCSDELSFENFVVDTEGVFNAGPGSTLVNTEGILAIDCADIVFPDFTLDSSCANSVIKLKNTSTGEIDEYEWAFGDGVSHDGDIHVGEPMVVFDLPGTYTIGLTVRNDAAEVAHEREVTAVSNSLGAIEILSLEQGLVASVNASTFTWYLDGTEIPEATGRILTPKASGVYRVAYTPASQSACSNRVSAPFKYELISSTTDPSFAGQSPPEIFPNPVTDFLNIKNTLPGDRIVLADVTGRKVLHAITDHSSGSEPIAVLFLNPGVYILTISRAQHTYMAKIIKR